MVSMNQNIVLSPDTQSRIDTLLHHVDTFLTLFNTTSATLQDTIPTGTVQNFDHTLQNIASTIGRALTPDTVSTFLKTIDRVANTFDRAITHETPNHLEKALKRIEGTFANIEAITASIRDSANVIGLLFVGLAVSVLVNVVLVILLRGRSRSISALEDRRKKAI